MPTEAQIEAALQVARNVEAPVSRDIVIDLLEAAAKVRKNELDPTNITTREDAYAALSAAFVHVLYCNLEDVNGALPRLREFHEAVAWAQTVLIDGGPASFELLIKPALKFLFPERKH